MNTKTKYIAFFKNGKTEEFFAYSFNQVIILALACNIGNNWDTEIDYISDKNGERITEIETHSVYTLIKK